MDLPCGHFDYQRSLASEVNVQYSLHGFEGSKTLRNGVIDLASVKINAIYKLLAGVLIPTQKGNMLSTVLTR